MTFSTVDAVLCTGPAARAHVTSINVHRKAYILHQRWWWIVAAASSIEGKGCHRREQDHFLGEVCIRTGFDEPHSTSSRSKGLSPEVITLSDSLLASCESNLGILWLDVPVPDLFSGCFRMKPRPCAVSFHIYF